jgi:ribonuclease PH
VALIDALSVLKKEIGPPAGVVTGSVAAISVGICKVQEWLDLCYEEDKDAEVDLNLVMTGDGQFIEVQGTGEEATFSRAQLDRLLQLGQHGIEKITAIQKKTLGPAWPVVK